MCQVLSHLQKPWCSWPHLGPTLGSIQRKWTMKDGVNFHCNKNHSFRAPTLAQLVFRTDKGTELSLTSNIMWSFFVELSKWNSQCLSFFFFFLSLVDWKQTGFPLQYLDKIYFWLIKLIFCRLLGIFSVDNNIVLI